MDLIPFDLLYDLAASKMIISGGAHLSPIPLDLIV